MATFLFDKIIFGPLQSRRLGLSLGVNLLSPASKHCNFDCIYCECGWNKEHPHGSFNSKGAVISRLEEKLIEMADQGKLPDVITFAGNGEPTMHPDFEQIINQTIALRDRYAPQSKVAVLSNATLIGRDSVRAALLRVDRNILKFDSAIDQTVALINQPNVHRPVGETIELLKQFNGCLVIQTMFLRGEYAGRKFDNTSQEEIDRWIEAIREIAPAEVMLYSLDRDTPATGLEKISREELEAIALQLRQACGEELIIAVN